MVFINKLKDNKLKYVIFWDIVYTWVCTDTAAHRCT